MSVTILQKIALVVTIIGAINWGLVALFQWDLVAWLFEGSGAHYGHNFLARAVYTLVLITGLINIGLLVAPTED